MSCPLNRILVLRESEFIKECVLKCRDYMTQAYGDHLANFIQLMGHFADRDEMYYNTFVILAVLNREVPFKKSVMDQSPNTEKLERFYVALSGSFEALNNAYFESSPELIMDFVKCCRGQYIIS